MEGFGFAWVFKSISNCELLQTGRVKYKSDLQQLVMTFLQQLGKTFLQQLVFWVDSKGCGKNGVFLTFGNDFDVDPWGVVIGENSGHAHIEPVGAV